MKNFSRNGSSNGRQQHNGRHKKAEGDISATYNALKEFHGQRYTGMKIGRTHKWYYDQGEWKEKKVTPDKWQFTYEVHKRRAGKAPEGSGVPVGTEYHWYIIADQNVRKLDANVYSTSMTGLKFKIAHKRADKDKWSSSDRAQRKRMIKVLQEMIQALEQAAAEAKREGAKTTPSTNGQPKWGKRRQRIPAPA